MADVPSGPSLDSTPHYANLKKFKSDLKCRIYSKIKYNPNVVEGGFAKVVTQFRITVFPYFGKLTIFKDIIHKREP
jgi:hypothetical protein